MDEQTEQTQSKMDDVAHDAAEAMRNNPGVALAALGLLTLGLGVGLWSLVKKYRKPPIDEQESYRSDFRRSGQY